MSDILCCLNFVINSIVWLMDVVIFSHLWEHPHQKIEKYQIQMSLLQFSSKIATKCQNEKLPWFPTSINETIIWKLPSKMSKNCLDFPHQFKKLLYRNLRRRMHHRQWQVPVSCEKRWIGQHRMGYSTLLEPSSCHG